MVRKGVMGLSAQIKDKLIQQTLERRLRQAGEPLTADFPRHTTLGARDIPEAFTRFDLHPGYQQLRIVNDGAERLGIRSPFFKQHEGSAGATTQVEGRQLAEWILADNLPVRMQLQLHKLLWHDEPGH